MTPREEAFRQRIHAAATKFVAAHPVSDEANGFYPSEENERVLFAWMEAHDLRFDEVFSYEEAFASCRDKLAPAPRAPAPRAKRPVRPAPKVVAGIPITHEALSKLTAGQLERLMSNREFVRAVNELPPPDTRIDK